MNRINDTFTRLKQEGRKALVGFLTAGDPDIETSEANIRTALDQGVDILELGIPFSDPTADGPTIQEAGQRALAAGMTVKKVLALTARIRKDYDTPIILFGYANPLYIYGYEAVCADAAAAGADGFLVVDMPFEEADELQAPMAKHGLDFIPLIAPTTPKERKNKIVEHASGFVYYIMVTGVTGERSAVAENIDAHVAELRDCTDLPICVGFGIGSGEQARTAAASADGVVVGSALVKASLSGTVGDLVAEIKAAI